MGNVMQRLSVMAVLVLASMVGGAVATLLLEAHASAQPSALTATQVNLVDGDGTLRAVVSARDERGTASLAFYDADGVVRSTIGLDREGAPTMEFRSAGGDVRMAALLQGDQPVVIVGDPDGRHAQLGADDESAMIGLVEGQRARVQLQLGRDGLPSLGLFDGDGRRNAVMAAEGDGASLLTLYEAGQPRVALGVIQDAAVINLSDRTRARMVLGVAGDGYPSMTLLDEAGDIVHAVSPPR